MAQSSGSLFFIGIVAILIVFQAVTSINFFMINHQLGDITDKLEFLTEKNDEKLYHYKSISMEDCILVYKAMWNSNEDLCVSDVPLEQKYTGQVANFTVNTSDSIEYLTTQEILDLVSIAPYLLSEDEVDLLISVAVGKQYGLNDPEIDLKAQVINQKIKTYQLSNIGK